MKLSRSALSAIVVLSSVFVAAPALAACRTDEMFAGADQHAAADGIQADLLVASPELPTDASGSGASVILTDTSRSGFAQAGWLAQGRGSASSFVAWSRRDGGVALRVVPGAPVGSLVVYKALTAGGTASFWFDHVDGPASIANVPFARDVSDAQVEAVRSDGGRLTGTRADPGVLGWISTRVGGRWSAFAPGTVAAGPGLAIRRVAQLEGERGTHLVVWDAGCGPGTVTRAPATTAAQLSAGALHDDLGIELAATASAARVSPARARAVALAAWGARHVLSTRLADCKDDQLVPALDRTCFAVALAPGARARPPIGPQGRRSRPALRSLLALVDAQTADLIETVAE